MKEVIFYGLIMVYLLYTLVESIEFYRTDKNYTKKNKVIHFILMWLIPFIYVLLIKSINKKTLGSHHYNRKPKSLGSEGNNNARQSWYTGGR